MINKFKRLRLITFLLRLINPRYSTCGVCGLPWNFCEPKSVEYTNGSGFFATCQYCWDNSPSDVIQKAYKKMHMMHIQDSIKYSYNINYDFNTLLVKVKDEQSKKVLVERIKKIKNIKNKIK